MVKRPKKFVIDNDSSPAVAQAKSREQRVATSFRVKMRKIIMNYHTRGQKRKTIIDYHEEFEQAQN